MVLIRWKILNFRINKGLFLTQTGNCSNFVANNSKLLNPAKGEAPQQQNLDQINEDNSVPREFSQKILSLKEQISRDFIVEAERALRKSQWFAMQISGISTNVIRLPKAWLSVEDREAINKGVKTKGYIFGYTTNSNAISPSPPASVDQYFIDENNRFCIYLKCVRQDPPSGCRPGRILKFRNSTNFEDRLIYISSLFEKPHQWWKTEPGYQALLHSMNIKSFVQHETDVVEKPSCMAFSRLSKVDGKSFNPEQSRAISASIDPNQPIVCIHGPSGSGKYRTAVEIAAMLAAEDKRGLFLIPSNDSFQKTLEDLKLCGIMEEQILLSSGTNHSRDYNVLKKCHPKWTQLDGLYQRLDSLHNFATNKKKHTSFDLQQIEAIQNEINFLFKSINSDLLRHINIIICQIDQIHFIGKLYEIYKPDFQIVINEKFSVNEYEYVSLIRQARKTIIIDDISQKYSTEPGKMSLIEYYLKNPGFSETDGSFHRFDTQYQSNSTLFDWPNRVLYQGKVTTDPSVSNLRLTDLLQTPEKSSSQLSKLFEKSLVFIDVDLAKKCSEHFCDKLYTIDDRALPLNLGEVAVMCEYAKCLFASGLHPSQIGFCIHGPNQRSAICHILKPTLEEFGYSEADLAIGVDLVFRLSDWDREVILMSSLFQTRYPSLTAIIYQLANMMSRTHRHFVLIGRRHYYESLKSTEIDELIALFHEKGVIVPPETIF